jgi:hypothetical protein
LTANRAEHQEHLAVEQEEQNGNQQHEQRTFSLQVARTYKYDTRIAQ